MLVFNLAAGQILKIDRITWNDTFHLVVIFVRVFWLGISFDGPNSIYFSFKSFVLSVDNVLLKFTVFAYRICFFFLCNVHVLKIYCNSETSKLTKFNRNCKWMQRKRTDKNCTAFIFFCKGPKYFYTQTTGPGQTRRDFVMEILMTPHIRMTFK